MAIVDWTYYANVYHGAEATSADFAALEARAEDVIGAMTRWQVMEDTVASLPLLVHVLVKKAVCAQVDYFAVNGLDSVAGGNERGWTVGKVTVQGKSTTGTETAGAMSAHISPMAIMYLEQTGLMNPQVATVPQMPLLGGWL